MSRRMSNDLNEIEWSVIGTLEGLIKEPIDHFDHIDHADFFKSAVIFVPAGIIAGYGFYHRPGKPQSLKKQSSQAQEEPGLDVVYWMKHWADYVLSKHSMPKKLMRNVLSSRTTC